MPGQQELYCITFISEVLGNLNYKLGYRFDFLRGAPTPKRPKGTKLPVDAFFPDLDLVVEFRESQHYAERVKPWDERVTATGDLRKEQRRRYDERREEVLPAHGLKLLIIYDYELAGNYQSDLGVVRQRLRQMAILDD